MILILNNLNENTKIQMNFLLIFVINFRAKNPINCILKKYLHP